MPGVRMPVAAVLLALACTISVCTAGDAASRVLLVDTEALTLSVLEHGRPQMTLHNIAIGRFGASPAKRRADNQTPLGRFKVTAVRRNSGFHRFIELDYPDAERANTAFAAGEIDRVERRAILAAHQRGVLPPQGTPLGGNIGIHGLGSADRQLHEPLNWTRGCVALTDRQVDSLLVWVRVGMTVEIR